ncbi:MAG: hypothetical protein WCV92_04930 [Candidatus Buchananbacteria bacterium]
MEQEAKNNLPQQVSEVKFSWRYQEYFRHEKTVAWYVVSLILLVLAVVWCYFDNNITFGMFLILFYLVVLLYNNLNSEIVAFTITADGIRIGKKYHFFREFDYFFIVYEEVGIKNLYLQFRNPLKGRLAVPLDGQDALEIRKFLLKYLREDLEREAEPISDRLRRWLKL